MTDDAQARIATVGKSDVVLFMKGTPVVSAMRLFEPGGRDPRSSRRRIRRVDVLQDQGVRQGIKAFSDWPTIPQLYVKGEFVGGSDIMMEMYESGELAQLLDEQGVVSQS